MYKKEDQDAYYLQKSLAAVMFDNSKKVYKTIDGMFDLDILDYFDDVISFYGERNCISESVKNNIYYVLVDARNIKDEYYKERIEKVNEILRKLNMYRTDDYCGFYRYEFYIRTGNKKFLKFNDAAIEYCAEIIDDSIVNDFIVLYTHNNQVDDDTFKQEFLDWFLDKKIYYQSLNSILKDCPSMFKEPVFINRVNTILALNKKTNISNTKNNILIKRKIKKIKDWE